MKRISEGIILTGDSRCIQEQTPALRAATFVFTKGWIFTLVISIVVAFFAFRKDSGDLLFTAMKFILLTVMLWFCSAILWSPMGRCPYCRHFFTMRKITANTVVSSSSRSVSRTAYDTHSGVAYDTAGNSAWVVGTSSRQEHGQEVTETFTYNSRCVCCGCVNKTKTTRMFRDFS